MDLERLTQKVDSLTEHVTTGTKYLKQNNYYSAIAEFGKVADNLPEAMDLATKTESYPPVVIGLYLQTVSQALTARQLAYLSIGEKEKAPADEEKVDTINTYISAINAQSDMKSTLDRIKAEEKKEEGASLGGCLIIIVIIVIIFMFLK
ncbi:MAG: hypothetical protein IJL14_09545 [Selenomonadaceae bacterium]|nr:hypothetical protein [Selenomonadaceae bacterium]